MTELSSDTQVTLEAVSATLGWLYFIAWSASFYPQVWMNWRRKNVIGLSLDFVYLNLVGFSAYGIYTSTLYYSPEIREQYRQRHDGEDSLVKLNDVVFGLHAIFFSIITAVQTIIYKRDPMMKRPWLAVGLISVITVGLLVMGGLTGAAVVEPLDLAYYFSYVKLLCSFSKYCPQLYLNYKRKSTDGWSIGNTLLDFTGGILSVSQELLDAYISGHWAGITGNVAKFGLGVLSMAFDIAFMIQHYWVYPEQRNYDQMDDGVDRVDMKQNNK